MFNLTHLSKEGVYGPVTATLDWCELNHQWSPYVAEMANTLSNLFTIVLSLCGTVEALKDNLPMRYPLGYLGVTLVGVGSLLFHATLLFEAQLADELPMIYVGSMSLWILFDNKPGFGLHRTRTRWLILALFLFDVLFTWSYMKWRNPVYHQIIFGAIVFATILRVAYILKWTDAAHRIPQKKKDTIVSFFSTGAGLFSLGFFLWNMDNIFCPNLTSWKTNVGWPLAFLLEGHSWWHVLTGLGTYYMFIGIQYVYETIDFFICKRTDYSTEGLSAPKTNLKTTRSSTTTAYPILNTFKSRSRRNNETPCRRLIKKDNHNSGASCINVQPL